MNIPSQQSFVAGNILTAAQLNDDVRDAINFLLDPPACKIRLTADVSRSSQASFNTDISMTTEIWDNDNIHSGGAPTLLTIVTPGRYEVTAQAAITANTTGTRGVGINKNAVLEDFIRNRASETGTWSGSLTVELDLIVGDDLSLCTFQNSGGALDVIASGTSLSCRWIGP